MGSPPMEREEVRVLLVEDDEDDYWIARDLLSEVESTRFVVEWVKDPELALQRLAEEPHCDICLLDYRLGATSGLDLLQRITASGFTLPTILLTGQDTRDIDEEAVRHGASDFLIKGRIDSTLLERSIRYALRQKRTEEALRQQTNFVSAVLDTATALVVVVNPTGQIARFNRASELVTGYQQAEVIGCHWTDLTPPAEVTRIRAQLDPLMQGQGPLRHEGDWKARDGAIKRLSWSLRTIRNDAGTVEFIVATGIDVTEQRRAEAELARARAREIEVGANIQRTLLVRTPPVGMTGLEMATVFRPSQRIGGDYCDFLVLNDRCVDVLVGDVMGKGVPAALLAAATKSHFQRAMRRLTLKLRPLQRLPEPEEIVSAVHAALTPELIDLGCFVTLVYVRFDRDAGTLTLVDCGHPRIICIDGQTGEVRQLSGENVPLGMSEREVYQQVTWPLNPGDLFFLYTDGVTEALDAEGDMFGEERLTTVLEDSSDERSETIVERVCDALNQFQTGDAQDDVTCVSVRVTKELLSRSLRSEVLEVWSDPEALDKVRAFAEGFCARIESARLDEDTCSLIVLALNEAISNVMRHAYEGRTSGRIQIEGELSERELCFRISDMGKPFKNKEQVPEPHFDGSLSHGFGMFILKQCFDTVDFTRDEMGRNTTTLILNLGVEAVEETP